MGSWEKNSEFGGCKWAAADREKYTDPGIQQKI